jgi:hypothetical protein
MNYAPIVLFCYKRLGTLIQTIDSLRLNDIAAKSDLIVFSDGPKNNIETNQIKLIRQYLRTVNGFQNVQIHCSPKNTGLAKSVINGVSRVIRKHHKVIVMEDDLLVTKNFLKFMNKALDLYENDQRIWSVSGFTPNIKVPSKYPHDIYIGPRPSSWGWGTWKDRWDLVQWDNTYYRRVLHDKRERKRFNKSGNDLSHMMIRTLNSELDSWAVKWVYHHNKYNSFSVSPVHSMVKHIGAGELATHSRVNLKGQKLADWVNVPKLIPDISTDRSITKQIKKIHSSALAAHFKTTWYRIKQFFK